MYSPTYYRWSTYTVSRLPTHPTPHTPPPNLDFSSFHFIFFRFLPEKYPDSNETYILTPVQLRHVDSR